MRKTGRDIICSICYKVFYRPAYHLRRKRIVDLCSRECVGKFNSIRKWAPKVAIITKFCLLCKKAFSARSSWQKRKIYCSQKCNTVIALQLASRNILSGERCWLWKGGITTIDKVIRTSWIY